MFNVLLYNLCLYLAKVVSLFAGARKLCRSVRGGGGILYVPPLAPKNSKISMPEYSVIIDSLL